MSAGSLVCATKTRCDQSNKARFAGVAALGRNDVRYMGTRAWATALRKAKIIAVSRDSVRPATVVIRHVSAACQSAAVQLAPSCGVATTLKMPPLNA